MKAMIRFYLCIKMSQIFNILITYIRTHTECIFWLIALLGLYLNIYLESDVSLCPIKYIAGFPCPGCGIGHAIGYALHLDFEASLSHHILGIPATLILLMRILQLSGILLYFRRLYSGC